MSARRQVGGAYDHLLTRWVLEFWLTEMNITDVNLFRVRGHTKLYCSHCNDIKADADSEAADGNQLQHKHNFSLFVEKKQNQLNKGRKMKNILYISEIFSTTKETCIYFYLNNLYYKQYILCHIYCILYVNVQCVSLYSIFYSCSFSCCCNEWVSTSGLCKT